MKWTHDVTVVFVRLHFSSLKPIKVFRLTLIPVVCTKSLGKIFILVDIGQISTLHWTEIKHQQFSQKVTHLITALEQSNSMCNTLTIKSSKEGKWNSEDKCMPLNFTRLSGVLCGSFVMPQATYMWQRVTGYVSVLHIQHSLANRNWLGLRYIRISEFSD
jgi:hypothetical protein